MTPCKREAASSLPKRQGKTRQALALYVTDVLAWAEAENKKTASHLACMDGLVEKGSIR